MLKITKSKNIPKHLIVRSKGKPNKLYALNSIHDTKKGAQESSKNQRWYGKRARIKKYSGKYVVYYYDNK